MKPIPELRSPRRNRPGRRLARRWRPLRLATFAMLGLAALGRASAAAPADFVVVVNAGNPATGLSVAELSQMFLQKTPRWPSGEKVMAVDLTEDSPAREAFSKAILDRPTSAVKAYWQKMIFSGRDVPPPEKTSSADVLAFVRSNPGGIGYVPAGTDLPSGVRALQVTDLGGAAGGEEQVYTLEAGMTLPEPIVKPEPAYTDAARRARIEGTVTVEATIDKQGNVVGAKVLEALPMGLDRSALTAVRKWKFKPATRNGQPVAVKYVLSVKFSLQ